MRGRYLWVGLAPLAAMLAIGTFAQTPVGIGAVVITKLSTPVYPLIARLAHVYGEVDVTVGIRRDGSVDSAVVNSGPRLLWDAALESARRSQFECRQCSQAVTPYLLTYTFQLGPPEVCAEGVVKTNSTTDDNETYPQVVRSQNHITVTDRAFGTCDLAAETPRKVRSIKCLFLWKCGYRSN